jgi:hypothetical protein
VLVINGFVNDQRSGPMLAAPRHSRGLACSKPFPLKLPQLSPRPSVQVPTWQSSVFLVPSGRVVS